MSSRQEEKERRRAERQAAEQAAAKSQARKERLQLGAGAAVALVAIIVAVVVFAGGGGGKGGTGTGETTKAPDPAGAKLPPFVNTDLDKAAAAAKCTLQNPPNEGSTHVTTTVVYKNSNPPASGNHNPTPAQDGIYAPGSEPAKENWVHSLEHGRIEIQYKPGTPAATVTQLDALGSESLGFGREDYKTLVFENNTGMKEAVAAVAWTHILACPAMNPQVYDAVRSFRKKYTDQGPEFIP